MGQLLPPTSASSSSCTRHRETFLAFAESMWVDFILGGCQWTYVWTFTGAGAVTPGHR